MNIEKDLYDFFTNSGIDKHYIPYLVIIIMVASIIIISWIAKVITQKILLKSVSKIVLKTKNQWDDILLKNHLFSRISLLIPAVVLYGFSICFHSSKFYFFTIIFVYIYLVIVVTMIINALLSSVSDIYLTQFKNKNKPIKAYLQTVKIFIYAVAAILIIARLTGQKPTGLLAGFGALTAIIMLVFKDSILGLVASFQLSAQKMVCIGDWIEMPTYGADGDVIDISLNTVKVQNWDKTISMIPTYKLISESFKNWNGMQHSGGRRIKRSIYIDMTSIKFCDNKMLDYFKNFEYLADYIDEKEKEILDFNNQKSANTDDFLINGRRLTNIGCFREYIKQYLQQHPKIHNEMTFLIRQLDPTEKGVPIQIYVFTNDIVWANYEAIQSDIFDHIFAIVAEFNLKVYQFPTGELK